MQSFQEMSLPMPIMQALGKLNFITPTPIQEKAIPVALAGSDIIACAQTGSGKTAAFALPLITRLLAEDKANALILAPTRELAKQISDVIWDLTGFCTHLKQSVLIGGSDMQKQFASLKRCPRIVIATPGRLTDHLRRGSLHLGQTRFLILDEGDRMLDMGFAPQLDIILKYLTCTRQTLLFTATLPPNVQTLIKKYLKNPVQISIGEQARPPAQIKQSSIQTTNEKKNSVLLEELNKRKGSVIIFARTKHRTDSVTKYLAEYGFGVTKLHGGRSQGQRNAALLGFREGKFRILVATDIAARGLDVPHIAHVINYDLPMMDDDYIHRIGRTARAGATGESLSLLTPQDRHQWMCLARKFKIAGVDFSAEKIPGLRHRSSGQRRQQTVLPGRGYNSRKPRKSGLPGASSQQRNSF